MPTTKPTAHGCSDSHKSEFPVSGLIYVPEYIDAATETDLLETIDNQPWMTDLRRRVQHYGWQYDYKARTVDPSMKLGDLPEWLSSQCQQLYANEFFPAPPDQVIINEYESGQGIAPHIDCVPCFEETIASLSLGSSCMMDFTNSKTGEKTSLQLEPRSLIVLMGDARYLWRHGIAPRKTDQQNGTRIPRSRRVSMTFRKVILLK